MSDIVTLETVLKILRASETANLIEWAITYGLCRYPQDSAQIIDAVLSLAEQKPECRKTAILALRDYDATNGPSPRTVDTPHLATQFSFQCAPETFHRRIVVAIATTAHMA